MSPIKPFTVAWSEDDVARVLDGVREEARKMEGRLGKADREKLQEYLASIRDRRVYPDTTSHEIRKRLDRTLPSEPSDFGELLDTFRDVILDHSRHNGHPRMFGYVQGPGTAVAAIADLLASTLNANLTAWRSAPAAVEIERLTLDWTKQILGLNPEAGGLFVSGGSMANMAALATARHAKAPSILSSQGAHSLGRVRVPTSCQVSISIPQL